MKLKESDLLVETTIICGNFIGTIKKVHRTSCEIDFLEITTNKRYCSNYEKSWILYWCESYIKKSIEEQVIDKIKYLSSKFETKQKLKHVSIS